MREPTTEGRDRLIAAAMAIRANCKRHTRGCGECPFADHKSARCTLFTAPPREWVVGEEREERDVTA